jgi:hypothetical protein
LRCKACDCEFSTYETIWRKKINQFEDLCRKCRKIVMESLMELDNYSSINNKIPQDTIVYYEDELEERNDEQATQD